MLIKDQIKEIIYLIKNNQVKTVLFYFLFKMPISKDKKISLSEKHFNFFVYKNLNNKYNF